MTTNFDYGPDLEDSTGQIALSISSGKVLFSFTEPGHHQFEIEFQMDRFREFVDALHTVLADIESSGHTPFTTQRGDTGSAFIHQHEEHSGIIRMDLSSPGDCLGLNFTVDQLRAFEIFAHAFAPPQMAQGTR